MSNKASKKKNTYKKTYVDHSEKKSDHDSESGVKNGTREKYKKKKINRVYQNKQEQITYGKICKRLILLFIIMSIIGFFLFFDRNQISFLTVPEPTDYLYINDYSGVFSEDVEHYIYQQAKELYRLTKAQIVLAAIPNTSGSSLENYSLNMANAWKIGEKNLDNGILILFTTQEPHVRMEIGYGLKGQLTNEKCGKILDDNAVSDISNRNWNQAAVNTWKATAKEVYDLYNIDIPKNFQSTLQINPNVESHTFADAKLPKKISIKNFRTIIGIPIVAFIKFWTIFGFPFYCLYRYLIRNISKENRRKLGTAPKKRIRRAYSNYSGWNDYGNSDSSSSGDSGGGGSFGGDGASR